MQTIAVIFGGRSTEHDISVVTALSSVIKPLELLNKYKVEAVYIAKDGTWFWDDKLKDITLFSSGKIEEFVNKTKPAQLDLSRGLTISKSSGISGKKSVKVDVVFPAMHGTYGEDGALMGVLDMANVAYVGCDRTSSSVAMDKVLAKQVAAANDINVTKYVAVDKKLFLSNQSEILSKIEKELKYPLFVKPAHLGSSIGISRAADKDQLVNAIEVAAHYDDKVLVEEEVQNLIEVTLPVMGNDDLTPASLERPLTHAEDFFDFETKYMQGGKKGGGKKGGSSAKGSQGYSEVPAKLEPALYEKALNVGLDTYKALGCSGIARVDMLIDGNTNDVYFNEVNPLPGGLYAHNWRASGVTTVELVDKLVVLAQEKHAEKLSVETTFSTNYLKQF